jgi:hypothetical protein
MKFTIQKFSKGKLSRDILTWEDNYILTTVILSDLEIAEMLDKIDEYIRGFKK